jgi:hypothetical protein
MRKTTGDPTMLLYQPLLLFRERRILFSSITPAIRKLIARL